MDQLPPELFTHIVELIHFKDRCSLSLTCRGYREALAESLFATLKFSRLEEDSKVIAHLVKKYGRAVKRLHCTLDLFPDREEEGDGAEELPIPPQDRSGLSKIASNLLNGRALPNVQKLKIDFAIFGDFEGDGFADESTAIWPDPNEDCSAITADEKEYSWRKVLENSMSILAQNESLTHLEISNLPPNATPVYETESWHVFMGRLKSLDLGFWGGSDHDTGMYSIGFDGYLSFVENTKRFFLSHLTSATYLRLAAAPGNPIGYTGMNSNTLPLDQTCAPQIRQLELFRCIIDPALVNFLKARSQQIQSLKLIECYSAAHYEDLVIEQGQLYPVSWSQFFKTIVESDPVLTELVIINKRLTEEEMDSSSQSMADEDQSGAESSQSKSISDVDDVNDGDINGASLETSQSSASSSSSSDAGERGPQEKHEPFENQRRFPYIIIYEKWGVMETNDDLGERYILEDILAHFDLIRIIYSNRRKTKEAEAEVT